jgi:hypothetical protein
VRRIGNRVFQSAPYMWLHPVSLPPSSRRILKGLYTRADSKSHPRILFDGRLSYCRSDMSLRLLTEPLFHNREYFEKSRLLQRSDGIKIRPFIHQAIANVITNYGYCDWAPFFTCYQTVRSHDIVTHFHSLLHWHAASGARVDETTSYPCSGPVPALSTPT